MAKHTTQAVEKTVTQAANAATETAKGWFETLKAKVQSFFDNLNLNQQTLVEYAAYFGVGFFSGFIFKKYARGFILYALIFGGLLYGLHYFEIITIDWTKLKDLIGMTHTDTGDAMAPYIKWAREHIMQLIIGIIGFVIGYNVG